jgi:hypothetical protein
MEKINFSIDINAPKEKVWNVLWNDESYLKPVALEKVKELSEKN